ncbi:MAG: signal peptidase I [Pseudomonadales bacterium]|nr:signal peptidase I [Pseudomonadales bacterium]
MDIDFSLVLVVVVGVTGFVSLLDLFWFQPKRKKAVDAYQMELGEKCDQAVIDKLRREPVLIEYPKSFFPVFFVVLLLRSFLVEPFTIPSGSMLPTLEVGDYILVNKFHYGLRLPVIGTKILTLGSPERGDIMVFKYPENPRINYIKRVIGLPGDTVRYQNNQLSINGKKVERKVVAKLSGHIPVLVYEEVLDGTTLEGEKTRVEHNMWTDFGPGRFGGEWIVPEGHYFMLGDNRDNSRDSRVWGFVPDHNVVGKAFAIWMHKPNIIPSFHRNGLVE